MRASNEKILALMLETLRIFGKEELARRAKIFEAYAPELWAQAKQQHAKK